MPGLLTPRLRLVWALLRLGVRYAGDRDSWRSREHDVPMHEYGPGNVAADFRWYLEGASAVSVSSLADVIEWLCGCQYEHDMAMFGKDDHWQHPAGFETLRSGDCEDHAMWAWRKLMELGYQAELVVGSWKDPESGAEGRHCWVVFRNDGSEWLLESVAKDSAAIVRLVSEVRPQYHPHVSIDHDLRGRVYAGYFAWLLDERARRRASRAVSRQAASSL